LLKKLFGSVLIHVRIREFEGGLENHCEFYPIQWCREHFHPILIREMRKKGDVKIITEEGTYNVWIIEISWVCNYGLE
jgi:hypothetical protein